MFGNKLKRLKMKNVTIFIIAELLKWICFLGFLSGIYKDNLFNTLFYSISLILVIILKEVLKD